MNNKNSNREYWAMTKAAHKSNQEQAKLVFIADIVAELETKKIEIGSQVCYDCGGDLYNEAIDDCIEILKGKL